MDSQSEIAAIASDTWGCESAPNESEEGINQPWHWITIPIMGITMGKSFRSPNSPRRCAPTRSTSHVRAPAIPITRVARVAVPIRWRSSDRSDRRWATAPSPLPTRRTVRYTAVGKAASHARMRKRNLRAGDATLPHPTRPCAQPVTRKDQSAWTQSQENARCRVHGDTQGTASPTFPRAGCAAPQLCRDGAPTDIKNACMCTARKSAAYMAHGTRAPPASPASACAGDRRTQPRGRCARPGSRTSPGNSHDGGASRAPSSRKVLQEVDDMPSFEPVTKFNAISRWRQACRESCATARTLVRTVCGYNTATIRQQTTVRNLIPLRLLRHRTFHSSPSGPLTLTAIARLMRREPSPRGAPFCR